MKSAIKQHTTYEIIDKISVRLVETHDKYWAPSVEPRSRLSSTSTTARCTSHDRLLMGGVWAEVTLRYDDTFVFKGQNRPFFVESIRPIQLSNRNIDSFIEARSRFTRDQWLDLLMRSMGYEPSHPYYTQAPQAALHAAARSRSSRRTSTRSSSGRVAPARASSTSSSALTATWSPAGRRRRRRCS